MKDFFSRRTTYLVAIFLIFTSFARAETIGVRIDTSKEIGKVMDILSSSIWVGHLQNKDKYIIDKFFSENAPATVQLSIPLGGVDFESFKDELKIYLNNDGMATLIRWVKKSNVTLIVGFDPCPMRGWLSSRPGLKESPVVDPGLSIESCSPPKDYVLWGEVVKFTLQQFKDLGVKNLGFYVGHEPDWDWLGTEDELFKYYKSAAEAAKSVSIDVLVGGIGTTGFDAKKRRCENYFNPIAKRLCIQGGWTKENKRPVTENFINRVKTNEVPLDFLNWHSFGVTPQAFPMVAETIRGWLRDAGIDDKKVRLYPSDWTYWTGVYPVDYLDTQETAAYIIRTIFYMWKAGIEWHGHDFNVYGYAGKEAALIKKRGDATFVGDWSVLTRGGTVGGGIIKPAYNALKALSMVTQEDGTRKHLSTEFSEEETVTAFATLTGNRKEISLIVTNFIPKDEKRFKRYILYKVKTQANFLAEEIKLIRKCMKESKGGGGERNLFLQCKNRLISTLKDPKKIEAINFIAKAYGYLNNKQSLNCVLDASKDLKYPEVQKIADTFRNIIDDSRNPKQVQIHFTNIPFDGKARLTTYTIDSTHSNACTFNKRTEPNKTNAPCGIGGAVDKAVRKAKERAKKEGMKEASAYLFSLGYTNKEVELLKEGVERCKGRRGMKECLNKLMESMDSEVIHPSKKAKNDLKEALKTYRKTYHAFYYNFIDNINSWKEVSLEGSKKSELVDIIDERYTLTLSMEPNSVWLVILNKEEE